MRRMNEDAETRAYYSYTTGLTCTPEEDMARQEFKADTDINLLLARFGVNTPQRQVTYGEQDYTMDLQRAHAAQFEAARAWKRLDDDTKRAFPSPRDMLAGLANGRLPAYLAQKKRTP